MKRNEFLKKGLTGLGSMMTFTVLASCDKDGDYVDNNGKNGDCKLSPSETAGPFPIRTPADLVRENIIGDRTGVALLINLQVLDQSEDCNPMTNALVDIWHCDAHGNYSEYGSERDKTYLRGRQKVDADGKVSFLSIFPGWYPGRAPHIHVEVLDDSENSIRVSQIAFPEEIYKSVYTTEFYDGNADTDNEADGLFRNSLDGNMLDEITGNVTDGFTMAKKIIV